MASARQAAASRQNGAQSNGPKTEEGKAKSARNSIKHGLCSKVLRFEDAATEAEFELLHKDYQRTYCPIGTAELDCVRDMAFAVWRNRVCSNMELAVLEGIGRGDVCAVTGGLGLPSLNTLLRYKTGIQRDFDLARATLLSLQAQRREAEPAENQEVVAAPAAPERFCTNEPEKPQSEPEGPKLNRKQRRRLEAIMKKKR